MVFTKAGVADPSDAPTYTQWSIEAARKVRGRPDSIVLFDSTIAEPASLLSDLLQGGLTGSLRDRFVSVFGSGNPQLIAAIAARYELSDDMVLTTTGAISGLDLLLDMLVVPGRPVLVEQPCFDILPILAAKAGADVRFVDRAYPDYDIDLEQVERGFAAGAGLLLLTNLHNPTGRHLPDARLLEIAALADRFGALVIVDEVYRGFADPGACAATLAPNIVTVNSLTKLYGLFSLKCGWVAGDAGLIARLRTHHANRDLGVCKLSHALAAQVMADSTAFDAHWQSILERTRPVLLSHAAAMRVDGLIEGDVPPQGCIWFPRLTIPLTGRQVADNLWQAAGVLPVPGELFGDGRHIRIGFGADADRLDRGMGRLHALLRGERP
ncbi:pyridoxal phosphate-dependent aminotransferase [Niveispirillum sp. KHB5.9]|uniref:pyridoxal phosphate-dependent aminotransferase n=1 Tax=Niveispirillum sp. KHB5.9 TaxID=3400269 RepID=UPI003A8826A1